jgi:hypothetical protein
MNLQYVALFYKVIPMPEWHKINRSIFHIPHLCRGKAWGWDEASPKNARDIETSQPIAA